MKDPTRKILLPFFFFLSFAVSAQSILEQKCDLQISNTPIHKALEILRENCGLDLVFSERFFADSNPVSLRAKGWTVEKILGKILTQSPVAYRELDGQLVFFLTEKKRPPKYTLSGFIEDAETGERLIAAAVHCPKLNAGTISNEYGFFSLSLPSGNQNVVVSYLGYQELSKEIELSSDIFFQATLAPSLTLAEVVVTPFLTKNELLPSPSIGTNLKADDFPAAPDLGGESDLLRMVQMLPGVQTGADGFGGLNIRGGSSEQNLVLLDGVPVYNPSHLLGIISIFNSSAVKSTQVIKGGIPARYGGRISAVIDVRTREGNTKGWDFKAGADFLSGKAALNGNFDQGRGTLLLTGRRSINDFLLKNILQKTFFDQESTPLDGYNFYDFNGKVSYRFSDKNRWYLSYYRGGDVFEGSLEEEYYEVDEDGNPIEIEVNETNKVSWGNQVASLRWNHMASPRVFANSTLTFTRYEFLNEAFGSESAVEEEFEDELDNGFYYNFGTDIYDVSLATDWEVAHSNEHYSRFGISAIQHFFIPEKTFEELSIEEAGDFDTLGIEDIEGTGYSTLLAGTELGNYFEHEFKWGDRWHINAGLRLSAFISDEVFLNPEPRLSANYRLSDQWKLKASIDRSTQYVHRLSFSEINLPNDVWIPADTENPPQRNWQATLGATTELMPGLELSVESFAKRQRNLRSFSLYLNGAFGEEDEFTPSTNGEAYGLEFFLRKTGQRTGGWLSYTWSKAERKLLDTVPGLEFDFRYDRRHDFKLYQYHRLNEHWQAGMDWIYGSPMPRLVDDSNSDIISGIENSYPLRKKRRIKPYHRLDLSLSYSKKYKWFEHTLKFSVYNLYDRENPVFYRGSGQNSEPVTLLPLLLGAHYGVKF